MGGAERLWWLLRHFGHDDCAVIDFDAWHGPLTSGEEEVEARELTLRPRDDDTIKADELARRRDELVVVDARLPGRWRGEPNPIDKQPGRIPGALNAPWNEPLPELPTGELVAYCGSGVTATVVLHRLHLAGREGRLYPGSWSEWEQLDLTTTSADHTAHSAAGHPSAASTTSRGRTSRRWRLPPPRRSGRGTVASRAGSSARRGG